MIDLHCHILPGLDDGAKTLDEALGMAGIAAEDGIETMVATPHLFRGENPRDFGAVEEKRQELREALAARQIKLEVAPGAEVHICHNLVEELRMNRSRLVVNEGRYMFVEFPPDHIYRGAQRLFFELMSAGVTPVIAHPERNSVFGRHPELLYDLVAQGALVQSNSGSLTGIHGSQAGGRVLRFMELNLVHFIASDGHNARSVPPRLAEAARKTALLAGKDVSDALVLHNPRAVLNDQEIPYLPSPKDPRKSKRSFSIRIPKFLRAMK